MSVRRLLAALGATVLLAGCGGDPEPKVEQSPTSPTTSPAQSETAKPASAEDVIRQWVSIQLEAQNSGDTSQLRGRFPRCRECGSFAGQIEDAYSRGGYVKAGQWQVRSIGLAGHVGNRYEYNLAVTAEPTKVLLRRGGRVQTYGGGPERFRMIFNKVADQWILTNYQAMP